MIIYKKNKMIYNKFIDNKYTVIKGLGQGSYGKAFLAIDNDDQNKVVIKEINLNRIGEKARNKVIQEGEILYQLEHKNIIKFIQFFLDKPKNRAYIIMEFAAEGDLSKKIREQRESGLYFKESIIIRWFFELCNAVKCCHDYNIIHRDIKPANIFLTEDNHIKLGDFGVSKILNSKTSKAQSLQGTPLYMSPEVSNKENYSFSCDIWSLGVILYELCTLNSPMVLFLNKFDINNIFTDNYSTNIKKLIQKMLKNNPNERPNINEVLEYIKQIKEERKRKYLINKKT